MPFAAEKETGSKWKFALCLCEVTALLREIFKGVAAKVSA